MLCVLIALDGSRFVGEVSVIQLWLIVPPGSRSGRPVLAWLAVGGVCDLY